MLRHLPLLFLPLFFFTTAVQAGPIDIGGTCSSFLRDLATPERVVEKWFSETEELFQAIVKKYPIATSEYILVGRSPSLLAAYLDVQKEVYADLHSWVLPISLKNDLEDVRLPVVLDRFNRVSDAFRPQDYQNAPQRKRVYIDLVATGRTFAALDRLVSLTGQFGDFVGYSFQPEHAKELFQELHLNAPLTLLRISIQLEFNTGEIKGLAPYSPLKIESEEPAPEMLKPESKGKAFQKALLALKKELFL